MKKIILILSLLFVSLFAEEGLVDINLSFYKTSNNLLTIDELKKKDKFFKKLEQGEALNDLNMTYWLKIALPNDLKDGEYVIRYAPMDFDVSSFSPEQNMKKMKLLGVSRKVSFFYKKERDAQNYYVRLLPLEKLTEHFSYYCFVQTVEDFEKASNDYVIYILICGFILGLISMAGFYNLAMYYYNREKSFLYYFFMQLSMVSVLIFYTGLVSYENGQFELYNFVSLIAAFFATLFVRAFLNTREHLPLLDKLLLLYLVIIVLDFIYLSFMGDSLLNKWQLYSFFSLLYLFVAILRIKQGYTPAKLFFLGWSIFVLSIIMAEYFEDIFDMSPLLLGAPIEAIFLAIALAYKIKMIADEKEQQKELLIHQSKLASMGEMIGNIAHQWRQPLTHLSYTVMNIADAFKHNDLSEAYLDKKVKEANSQIEFMSQTIDDFKDFYEPTRAKEEFSLEEASREVLEIMSHALSESSIELDLFVRSDVMLYNYKNEYKQVLLNLLSNAKDALLEKQIAEPKIMIMISDSNAHNAWVVVSDNAGGIGLQNINQIFEPYFTTKEENSGIGLYMSKMIVEKNMQGKLSVKNDESGAVFSMIF